MATKYVSSLTGEEMDAALIDMAYHNSEAYAVGTRNGVPVGSSDVTYHNNSKYWAEQVYGYTDRAEDAANRAEAAVPSGTAGAVFFDRAQTLTSAQQSQARANIMAGGSNRNLLDNPWWGSGEVVNQRAVTAKPSTNGSYTIDRWKLSSGTDANQWAIGTNGITFTIASSSIWYMQIIPNISSLFGKTLTASVMFGDGTIKSGTATLTSSASATFWGDTQSNVSLNTAGTFQITVRATQTIRAVKLELGSVSTLANDAPPDYWQELDKCLYYFERITNNGSSPLTIGAGFADGVNNLYAPVRMHRKRAGIATVSYSGTIYAGQRSSNIVVSSMTQYNSSPDGIITLLAVTPSSFTSNGYYRLALGAGAHIDFSADL